jgi:hypothetical protein
LHQFIAVGLGPPCESEIVVLGRDPSRPATGQKLTVLGDADTGVGPVDLFRNDALSKHSRHFRKRYKLFHCDSPKVKVKVKRIGQVWLPAYGSQSQSSHRVYLGLLLSYPLSVVVTATPPIQKISRGWNPTPTRTGTISAQLFFLLNYSANKRPGRIGYLLRDGYVPERPPRVNSVLITPILVYDCV